MPADSDEGSVHYSGEQSASQSKKRGGSAGDLVRLRSKTVKFKKTFGRTSALHCLSGLITLNSYLFAYPLSDLQRLESVVSTDAGAFQNFDVFTKKSCRMKSRRLPTKMHRPGKNMSSALDSMLDLRARYTGVLLAHAY